MPESTDHRPVVAQPPDGASPTGSSICGAGACLDRRMVLRGVALSGALGVLAACGSDQTAPSGGGTPSDQASPSGEGSPSGSGSPSPKDSGEDALTTTGEIEVGGGLIFGDDKVVVTQPEQGMFKAFTAVCTHQGCIVASVADGTITCDCHGSQYDAATGEVTRGPATAGLAEQTITVEGDQILLG